MKITEEELRQIIDEKSNTKLIADPKDEEYQETDAFIAYNDGVIDGEIYFANYLWNLLFQDEKLLDLTKKQEARLKELTEHSPDVKEYISLTKK